MRQHTLISPIEAISIGYKKIYNITDNIVEGSWCWMGFEMLTLVNNTFYSRTGRSPYNVSVVIDYPSKEVVEI